MSEPMGGTSTTGTGGTGGGSAGNSTMILIFGIISVVCCSFLGPVAWYMGKKELAEIAAGTLPAANEGATKAGMILGIIGTALLVFSILWIFFFGGMAILGAAVEQ